MKKSNWMPSLVLGCICIVVALLLSVVNMVTAPIIEAAQSAAANAALLEVLPNGKNFEEIEITSDYPAGVIAGYRADGGFVFQMSVTGKSSGLVIMCGVDAEGKVTGTKVIANEETPGYAAKVFPEVEGQNGKYTGMDLAGFEPYLVSGATMTSRAYGEAIKAALQSAVLAAGGSVDVRNPEQILQDTCNAALGTEGKTFERWFATEYLEGVNNVYTCDAGIVMILGDKYVGVNGEGSPVLTALEDGTTSEVSADDKAVVQAAYALYSGTTLTEVERPTDASKRVTKIEVTATGNYVMYMRAAGNGINGEDYSHPSGEYIEFMVCISADGKIIDVKTTYQSESKGYGDACATDAYTEQFKGATADKIVITPEHESSTSTDLGIISGSTITSNGYQRALQQAFAAFELLTKGGNE